MDIEKLLCNVVKPARYAGGELNSIVKDPAGKTRFALAFPDIYEVGMSHLGSRILYHIINSRPDALCERAFLPWPDMQEALKASGTPLFSLESRRPLSEFDMIGITLQYEMNYAGVLRLLELSGIPLLASERDETHPLIIGGGPCAFNPEPVAPFFDLFVIGDGEEALANILNTYASWKKSGRPRQQLFEVLSRSEGVYVPSFYEPEYHDDGTLKAMRRNNSAAPETIRRAFIRDLDHAPCPAAPVVPYLPIVHDRMVLEVFRGCTQGCRFCQAGYIYRPVRERRVPTLVELARKMQAATGYEEISLSSLSTGDYSQLGALVGDLRAALEPLHVSLSLPSLRLGTDISGYGEGANAIRRAGLTLAPEAGTQRLRDRINKKVTENDLLKTASEAFQLGWNAIKLYFMIGLPFETQEDIAGLAALIRKTSDMCQKGVRNRGRAKIKVSLASFVPKPFTPFQWSAQDTPDRLNAKQRDVVSLAGGRGIEVDWHDVDTSVLEAVLARGDRRLAGVLIEAAKAGAGLDGWREHFKKEQWDEAFLKCGVDPAWYASRERKADETLPWDHIDAGVSKAYLREEFEKAMEGTTTPDCRSGCTGCGLAESGVCAL